MQQSPLTEFNEGGTHEQNPIGGIPQGVAPDGTPNSVEEGETKFSMGGQHYIFSNRFTVADKYLSANSLPSYLSGKTFAEASKEIEKRFKDREDNASMSTKIAFFDRLKQAQEVAKIEKEALDAGMSVEDYMAAKVQAEVEAAEAQVEQEAQQAGEQAAAVAGQNQEMPEGTFATGGAMNVLSGVVDQGGLDIVSGIMEDQESDQEVRDEISVGGSTAKYAMMGAAAGSVVPGVGTAIGAGVGAAAGAASAVLSNNKIAGEQQTADRKEQGRRLLADGYKAQGGNMYTYAGGTDDPIFGRWDSGNTGKVGSVSDGITSTEGEGLNEKKQGIDPVSLGALGASLAPFVGNLIEGASLKQSDPIRYQGLGRTYTPEFADERSMLNIVDESFGGAEGTIANATAGDIGAYRANLLGSNINKVKARQAAFSEINDINRQERKMLNADAANAAKEEVDLYNKEIVEAQQDKAAFDEARAAYRTAAYEGLGKIGETIFGLVQQEGLTPYNWADGRRKQDEA